MNKTINSKEPEILGQFEIDCKEFLYVQYMPIRFPLQDVILPANLECFLPLIQKVMLSEKCDPEQYIYLTAKKMYVGDSISANRPGWHIDGYGSNDFNFLWSDSMPTEFCVQHFSLSDDHNKSLFQMQEQALESCVVTYPKCSLIGMDNTIVHRVSPKVEEGYRTFCKISLSFDKYNLKGNAHNPYIDYEWQMAERSLSRNHPVGA